MNEALIVSIQADIRQLQGKLQEATTELNKFSNSAKKTGNEIPKGFNNITNSIKGLIAGFIGLQAAIGLVNRAFSESIKLESISAAYTEIFKSSEMGELQLKRLQQRADFLGLSFLDLADAYKTFAGAAYTVGLNLEDTNKIFDAVSNASAKMKLDSEQTKGALLALGQMISKGVVSMEELRQQLGERLPGAIKIFADGMGVSVQQMTKMIESGKVLSNEALPKFANRLNEIYGTNEPIKGLQASINELSNTFTNAVNGGAIGKFFKAIVDGAVFAIKAIEDTNKGIQLLFNEDSFKASQGIKDLTDEINKLVEKRDYKGLADIAQNANKIVQATKGSKIETDIIAFEKYLKVIKLVDAAIKELNKKTDVPKVEGAKKINTEPNTVINPFADVDLSKLQETDVLINDFVAQTNLLNSNLRDLAVIGGETFNGLPIIIQPFEESLQQVNSTMMQIAQVMTVGIAGALEQAILNGQNFGKAMLQMLKQLIARLLAAAAAAALLAALVNIGTFGASAAAAQGSFGAGFGQLFSAASGINLNRSASVAGVPVNSQNGGSVSFEIKGDKLYGVLENYTQRLDRIT